jgi:hypothetical protein
LGRDYKIVIQQIPVVLNELIISGTIIRDDNDPLFFLRECFVNLGKLSSLAYVRNIKFNSSLYILAISGTYEELRSSVLQYESAAKAEKPNIKECNIYNSSKMHILSHLPSDIARFGSSILFETEKGKQVNKFIRECWFRTNCQSPSRDAAVAFAKRMMTAHVLTGGAWQMEGQSQPLQASVNVLQCASSLAALVRDFADNDDKRLLVKVGFTGVFQNRYGNQLIGKVTKVDGATASYTVNEYALWIPGEATKLPVTIFCTA